MQSIDPSSIDQTQKENNIRELQHKLRGLSYADSTLPRPAVTGIFDETTDDAVRAFQTNRMLAFHQIAHCAVTWCINDTHQRTDGNALTQYALAEYFIVNLAQLDNLAVSISRKRQSARLCLHMRIQIIFQIRLDHRNARPVNDLHAVALVDHAACTTLL